MRTRPLLDVRPCAKRRAARSARSARSGIPILHVPLEARVRRATRSMLLLGLYVLYALCALYAFSKPYVQHRGPQKRASGQKRTDGSQRNIHTHTYIHIAIVSVITSYHAICRKDLASCTDSRFMPCSIPWVPGLPGVANSMTEDSEYGGHRPTTLWGQWQL